MNFSSPNFTAFIFFLTVHTISVSVLAVYALQFVRVRAQRNEAFGELGPACMEEIRKLPILMWLYVISVLLVIVGTSVAFLFLLPNGLF